MACKRVCCVCVVSWEEDFCFESPRLLSTQPPSHPPSARRPLPLLAGREHSLFQVVHIFTSKTSTSVRLQSVLSPQKSPQVIPFGPDSLPPATDTSSATVETLIGSSLPPDCSLFLSLSSNDLRSSLCQYSKNRGQSQNSSSDCDSSSLSLC